MKAEAHHGAWGLGTFDRWDLDMILGDLVFSNKDGTTATCPCQIIGTQNTADETWMWAWANPSIPDALKVDALKVKEYGESHQVEQLTTAKIEADEADAWAFTALSVKLCQSQGAYRGPAGNTLVFITFSEVKLAKTEPRPRKGWWPWSK